MLMSIWATGTLIHCWWECKMVQPFWKTVWQFLKKLNILLTYNPSIMLLGIYSKELNTNLHMDVYSIFFHKCQNLEAIMMSFNRWMDKLWYIQWNVYSALKRKELSSQEKAWRKPERILWSERSQSEKAMHYRFQLYDIMGRAKPWGQ